MFDEPEVRAETLKYFNNDELATNVFITKYCLKNSESRLLESTPDDMHHRLSSEFARIEEKFKTNRSLSEEEIYSLFKNFKYIVPQGSPMMGIGNNFVNVSLSNCVVVDSPQDNISSIVDSGKELANLFKRRCGVGLDISNLRPDGAFVNNSAGTTTGAWSFADFYSYVCRMIGQNGRRGALMISMDVRHPDIEKFVTMKHDLTKVTGANVSVKISDDFMEAVEKDEDYILSFPVGSPNPKFKKTISAKELWTSIVESATKTAEPGLLMWDNIINNLPAHSYPQFKTISTNPCAEIPLSAYDSCRLISINLKHFIINPFEENAYFDFEHFKKVVSAGMRLSDDLVELEAEKLSNIQDKSDTLHEKEMWGKLLSACLNGRRTGLGTHGLADALACLNQAYDSEEAIGTIDKIYQTLRDESYRESVELAKERGAFEVFDWEIEKENAFIKNLPEAIQKLIQKHGRRNISILTNAPTGSVSIMSQTSSGLEPVFRNFYTRRRKISHNEDIEADFVDDLGDKWKEFKVFHHNIREWVDKTGGSEEDLPAFFIQSDEIDWTQRILIQATIQKYIDHAISSTINLPKETTPDVVGNLYLEGWKRGLKGITVYVDGSRSGVLIAESSRKDFPYHDAPKRPLEIECDIHHTTIQGEKWTLLIGLYDDKPYELIGGLSNLIEIPKKYKKGFISKHSFKTVRNRYDLRFGEDDNEVIVRDIVSVFNNPNNSAFTRMLSLSLRHGAKPAFLVEQLQKDKESDYFSFSKCIARVLKIYIQNGEKVCSEKVCQECNQEGLIYQDGCALCPSCGHSKCG